MAALRLGLRAEADIEQAINRNVLDRPITWDSWARKHPRFVGFALCLVSVALWWQL